MKAAKDCGMAIRTWTVDDPAQIVALADLGVDAVVTNDVAAARRALGRSELPDAAPPRSVPPPAAG
jgi:glycerophosphoryl diester phosphodiesterase